MERSLTMSENIYDVAVFCTNSSVLSSNNESFFQTV